MEGKTRKNFVKTSIAPDSLKQVMLFSTISLEPNRNT
ncbi:hypothetical protein Mpal_0903 [Methanosphaerula palustris E1-9c]|uniref:Uncharacterized protein n=1 Tax=Methanosphaerula palustris (strain ATCC BAA-1556 / DSM 19958 / E1-9c) TaxID=521011 RepID=B8GGK2_METPE|nr:hypothetical protein Mpal_0903 [Methanosphaerula palustris E1-9c]